MNLLFSVLFLDDWSDLLLGGVRGDEVINLSDNIDTDGAGEVVVSLGGGQDGTGQQQGQQEGGVHDGGDLREGEAALVNGE